MPEYDSNHRLNYQFLSYPGKDVTNIVGAIVKVLFGRNSGRGGVIVEHTAHTDVVIVKLAQHASAGAKTEDAPCKGRKDKPVRVLVLPSTDGQMYAKVIIIPDHLDTEKALELCRRTLAAVREARDNEDTWEEDIAPALEKAGFTVADKCYAADCQWD